MQINHNIRAMITQNSLFQNNNAMSKSLEKLSTGLRINRAQDDAAGLAMSEQMRNQIRSMGKAKQNSLDGQAALQIAEGALGEIDAMLKRQKELSIQAASDTLTDTERKYLNDEFQELTKEIDRIAKTTDYNGKNVLIYNPDSNKSFGAEKLASFQKDQIAEEAISMLQKYFGGNLDGGFSFIGTGTDSVSLTSINACVAQINSAISALGAAPSADSIKAVLVGLTAAGSAFIGDQIKIDVSTALNATLAGLSQTGASALSAGDLATIHKINQFMDEVLKANSLLTVVTSFNSVDTGSQAVQLFLSAFALGTTMNSAANGMTALTQTVENGGNYDSLIKAVERVNSAVAAATGTASLASMDAIFGSSASEQMKKDIQLIMNYDVSKMKIDGAMDDDSKGDATITLAWKRGLEMMQEAYNHKDAVGSTGSDILHIGANYSQGLGGPSANEINVKYTSIDVKGLGISRQNIDNQSGATKAIDQLDKVIKEVSGARAKIGTYINRLEYTVSNLSSLEYNTQDAESRIRDTDFAKETTNFTRNQIMVQASTSMLSQANALPQSVLSLIG